MLGKYSFKAYTPKFKSIYLKEKSKILKALSTKIKIEHVGSTSVPGLGGKGIIDIAILTPRKDLRKYFSKLAKIGFEYHPHPGDDKRKFLQKIIKYSGKERRVHIHLCLSHEFFDSFIAFREYLIKHKGIRDEYAKLKKDAVRHAKGDGKKYGNHKIDFLKRHTLLARKEFTALAKHL